MPFPMTTRASSHSSARGLEARSLAFPKLLVLGFALLATACGASARLTVKEPGGLELPIEVEHEACDLSRGQATDVNGDGRPDVVRVEVDGRELCRMVDLNFDGRPDAFIYFDEQGKVRRRESDFDRDGRIDEIATYVGGQLVRKDRDTNLDGKLDTWDFFEGGRLVRRLRDTMGVGKVSQWWSFSNPSQAECAVIQSDRDGDGLPDTDDVLDTCAEYGEPSSASSSPSSEAPKAPDDAEPSAPNPPEASAEPASNDEEAP